MAGLLSSSLRHGLRKGGQADRVGTLGGRAGVLAAVTLLMTILGGLTAVGCGSSGDAVIRQPSGPKPPSRPARLSRAQALRVSQMLYHDHLAGGAEVAIATTFPPATEIRLQGFVDWSHAAGRLQVSTSRTGMVQIRQRVVYVGSTVYTTTLGNERRSGAVLSGRPARSDEAAWSARPADPRVRPIDRILELVGALAAAKPDNPALVRQGDLRFDRTEMVRGHLAEVFTTKAKGLSYWVDRKRGTLMRVRGTLPGFSGPVVVDLLRRRADTVTAPGAPTRTAR